MNTEQIAPMYEITKPVRSLLARSGVQKLLDTAGVTEVAINRPGELWYEQANTWKYIEAPYLDYDLCKQLAQGLAVQVADDANQLNGSPICPVQLPDGQRGQIVIPPATEKGCISFTIRQPSRQRFTIDDYENSGRFSRAQLVAKKGDIEDHEKEMVMCLKKNEYKRFFQLAVQNKLNLIFGGKTGSGKTTFSKAIVDLYPTNRRYITIEDVNELFMPNHPNRVHLFYGDKVEAKDLVKSCMRMKADHIFLSELKGEETWSYLNLLNTGHSGSITTAHFNSCEAAPFRLADIVKESPIGSGLDYSLIVNKIKSLLDCYSMWEGSYLTKIMYRPEEKLELLNRELA